MSIIPAEIRGRRFYVNGVQVTKSEAIARCKKILHDPTRPLRDRITGDDLSFIGSILLAYRDDVAPELLLYVAGSQSFGGSLCFWYRTIAGVCDGFSYRAALQTPDARLTRRIQKALRAEIQPQVREWRLLNGITDPDIHADHIIPFSKICSDFLTERGLVLDDIQVSPVNGSWQMADHTLANDWYRYHQIHARFQALPAAVNVAKGATIPSQYL